MALTDNVSALALRTAQEIKSLYRQVNGSKFVIGSVSTLPAGQGAAASVTTVASADGNTHSLNLGIPAGATGASGTVGGLESASYTRRSTQSISGSPVTLASTTVPSSITYEIHDNAYAGRIIVRIPVSYYSGTPFRSADRSMTVKLPGAVLSRLQQSYAALPMFSSTAQVVPALYTHEADPLEAPAVVTNNYPTVGVLSAAGTYYSGAYANHPDMVVTANIKIVGSQLVSGYSSSVTVTIPYLK